MIVCKYIDQVNYSKANTCLYFIEKLKLIYTELTDKYIPLQNWLRKWYASVRISFHYWNIGTKEYIYCYCKPRLDFYKMQTDDNDIPPNDP